jgi:hypothetical protein
MTPVPPRLLRAAYFLAAPLFCMVLFWRALSVWFLNDDFAWLGLRLQVHDVSSLITALFQPQAEGTVRFISERLYFLIFSTLFHLDALPFRICALATWFANLTLAAAIGTRLIQSRLAGPAQSRAAGLLAAILWTLNAGAPQTLMWASSYNQDLCALCILLAFYARLRWIETDRRRWIAIEWAAYLAGFGVLEVMVMYPFIAALHALCVARKRFFGTLPLLAPSAIFLAVHFFLIPKTTAPVYRVAFDARLPSTLLNYLQWTLAPVLSGEPRGTWHTLGAVSAPLVGAALLAFTAWRLHRRDFVPLFFIGWFVLFLIPILPLPEHLTAYYVTIPSLGLAWLAGWAIVSAVRSEGPRAGLALALAAAYFAGSWYQARLYENWLYARSNRLRIVVESADAASRDHPGSAILLAGVDNDLFGSGFQDSPFRLIAAEKIYMVPDSEKTVEARPELGGVTPYVITPRNALEMIDRGRARVLDVSTNSVHDITRTYAEALRHDPQIARRDFVDVGDPAYAGQLGDTWYKAEGGARWMPKSATVRFSGIAPSARTLHVIGFAPPPILASGPVRITLSGNGREIGSAVIKSAEGFDLSFPLPQTLVGNPEIGLTVTLDKVLHLPGDNRDLGIVFGTFSIR